MQRLLRQLYVGLVVQVSLVGVLASGAAVDYVLPLCAALLSVSLLTVWLVRGQWRALHSRLMDAAEGAGVGTRRDDPVELASAIAAQLRSGGGRTDPDGLAAQLAAASNGSDHRMTELLGRVTELKRSSEEAMQRVSAVMSLADSTGAVVQSGEEDVEKIIEQNASVLGELRTETQEIAKKIVSLADQTQRIGEITAMVKGLGDRSNILAINAAIEASHSGVHGRGFAVVAKEMRRLADQSIQATEEVRTLLRDIRMQIEQAVELTVRSAERMDGGMAQIKASGENMRAMSSIVNENADILKQMASLVTDQNTGIQELSERLEQLK